MLRDKSPNTQMIDLEEKTPIPAFIDAYGHLLAFAKCLKTVQSNKEEKNTFKSSNGIIFSNQRD